MKKQNIASLIDSFSGLKALIIGDVMVDSYLWGNVERISPEAPVPIVAVTRRENRPGGAANVALNVKSLGAIPVICSCIGDDAAGREFLDLLSRENIPAEGMVVSKNRTTTVKSRIIGNNHQMIRIDEEVIKELTKSERNVLLLKIKELAVKYDADVIIFEDYDKGVITGELIEEVVAFAKNAGIPITADPKKKNFLHYKGVTLFKPNLKELREGLKIDLERPDRRELDNAAGELRKSLAIDTVLITLSEHGIYINNGKVKKIIPAHLRNIADVSGAGDTVISVASMCLALKLPPEQIAVISNIAGGQVCEKVGVAPVDKKQLVEELLAANSNSQRHK
ncbi:MAG: D-glycero-beta-D-manno-heptose-7-phosphate kinase [Bacteroidetes bacterium]|nr:D-glycero-beta-D-manno-heptose-7-phosphate kinase [Bacteroidota bacterium]